MLAPAKRRSYAHGAALWRTVLPLALLAGCTATAPALHQAVNQSLVELGPRDDESLTRKLQVLEPAEPPLVQLVPPEGAGPAFRMFEPPSNDRDWSPDMAKLSSCEFGTDGTVTVRNIRNARYVTTEIYTVEHYDKTFDLNKIESVDFFVCPFTPLPLAHTFLSFGFGGNDFLCVSVEIRRERGEKYMPFRGIMNQFEIMYVVADERDVVGLRTNIRGEELFMYRMRATPERVRTLFVDMMQRVNALRDTPEYYHTINNNCTTNILKHVNRVIDHEIPYNYQVLLPALADRLAYDQGLIETDTTFERTKLRARINEIAYIHRDDPEFSLRIRE